jgi:hypothetical protein
MNPEVLGVPYAPVQRQRAVPGSLALEQRPPPELGAIEPR